MSRIVRTTLRLVAAVAVVAAVGVAVLPSPASAHATLIGSSPRQDAQLDHLPDRVSFEFNQDMSAPAYVIVTAPDGSSVTEGDPDVDGAVVSQAVTNGPDGTYTMAYRAVSEDGHPVTGEITFTVGVASSAAPGPSSAASASPGPGDEARTGSTGAEAADDESFLSRHVVAILVGLVLFGAAGALLLIARRTEP